MLNIYIVCNIRSFIAAMWQNFVGWKSPEPQQPLHWSSKILESPLFSIWHPSICYFSHYSCSSCHTYNACSGLCFVMLDFKFLVFKNIIFVSFMLFGTETCCDIYHKIICILHASREILLHLVHHLCCKDQKIFLHASVFYFDVWIWIGKNSLNPPPFRKLS